MTNILNLIKKDYRLFWNDKVAVALTFLVPAALILVFGSIFGGSGGGDASGIRLAFINQSNSKIARKIESTLDTTKTFQMIKSFTDDKGNEVPFDTNSIKEYIINGSASSALVIPKDAYTDTSFGLKLRFFYNPRNQLEMQIVQGLLQQTIMTQIPEIFNQSMMRRSEEYLGIEKGGMFNRRMASVISEYFGVDTSEILNQGFQSFENDSTEEDTSRSKAASQFFKDIVRLDSEQLVGKEINNPGATRSVGGWAMMFLLFSITASAASLFDERNSGVTLRILSAPVSRTDILWSKYLYNISLGVIQLLVLFFMGYLFFNINIFSNFGNLLLVIILSSAAATAFGMLLAAFSKTTAQANGMGTFLILMMSTIGGAWFPTFFLPPFIQILSKFTIVYWSVEGFLQVLWNGDGFIEILPTVGMLIGIGIVINAVSFWRFRRGDIF